MDSFIPATAGAFGIAYYFKPGALAVAASWMTIYVLLYAVIPFLRSAVKAHRTGFPVLWVPWAPHSLIWTASQMSLRSFMSTWLPRALWNRIFIASYGWEFAQGMQPFNDYGLPQGDRKSFVMASFDKIPELYTWDAEVATQILSRPRDFGVEALTGWVMSIFGHNVFTSNGEVWARQRKIIAGVINEKISKSVFNETMRQTQGLLDEVFSKDIANTTTANTNKMADMMKKITVNVLSGAGMGTTVPWDDTNAEKARPGYKMNYMSSINPVLNAIGGPAILPKWFLANYPSWLPGAEFMSLLNTARDEYPVHTRDLLDKERQRLSMNKDGDARGNIMSGLLRASEGNPDAKGRTLSEDEMVGNLFIFTLAGFDTTANTLNYALLLLARYPEWQNWLLEEIDTLMPQGDMSTAELDYATIHPKATRVLAYMFETLRLFPPLVHIVKQAYGDQVIQTSKKTYFIPDGCVTYVNTVCTHLNSDVYRNLNVHSDEGEFATEDDELRFRPSRWINTKSTGTSTMFQPPKGAFLAWSMGPRSCPGIKMAQVEFVAVLLTLLRQHRIEATPSSGETRQQVEQRLDAQMRNSVSKVTLEMVGVYGVVDEQQGVNLTLRKRR